MKDGGEVSRFFETKPKPTSCTDVSRNQSPCASLTLPKRNLDVVSRQSASLSRSLVESQHWHSQRQEITESVVEQSTAEFAKGIHKRQKLESDVSGCKLKEMADCLVESSKRDSKKNEMLIRTRDASTASEVTLRATQSCTLLQQNRKTRPRR